MVGDTGRKHPMQRRDQSPLLRLQRRSVVDGAGGRIPDAALSDVQALELGGNVRKGARGTKVYFVKQLQVRDDGADGDEATRLVPMMREYTVFNVDQCDGLPDRVAAGKPARVRNPDTREALADEFLRSTSADLREGHGEAYYVPSQDFISMPAFEAFKGADQFYGVAFHELTHWTGHKSRLDRDLTKEPLRLAQLRGRRTHCIILTVCTDSQCLADVDATGLTEAVGRVSTCGVAR